MVFPDMRTTTTITLDVPGAVMDRARAIWIRYGGQDVPFTLKANAATLACFREGFRSSHRGVGYNHIETDLGLFHLAQDDDMPTGYALLVSKRLAALVGPEDGVVSQGT